MRQNAFTPTLNRILFITLSGLLLFGCNEPETSEAVAPEFAFSIDPISQSVMLDTSLTTEVSVQILADDEPRPLRLDSELKLTDFNFSFLPGNKLIIDAIFKNVTEASEFHQPFIFKARSFNVVSSQEPSVSDDDLGGDGVLSPGETSSKLRFEVTHKNQPFFYFVQASAVVKEESSGESPDILSFEVDQSALLEPDVDGDGNLDPYEMLHYTVPPPNGPAFSTFTKLKWEIKGEGPLTLSLTATTDGGAVSTVKSKEFVVDGVLAIDVADGELVALNDALVDGDTVILTDFEVGDQPLANKEDNTPTSIPFTFTLTATNKFGTDSMSLDIECCEIGRALQGN